MSSKETNAFIMTGAFALFSILVGLLCHFVLHGWFGTVVGVFGAIVNIIAVTGFPHVPGSGSIKRAVFVFMGVPSAITAAVFGFIMYGLGGGFLYLLFTFVLYLVSFALRR